MTELSDYQRIIERPRIEKMQAQINALAADRDRLRAALQRVDGINDNPARFSVEINDVVMAALSHGQSADAKK